MLNTKYISCELHGFREEDIFKFFPLCLLELMTPGRGQCRPNELDWQDVCRGPLNIATY